MRWQRQQAECLMPTAVPGAVGDCRVKAPLTPGPSPTRGEGCSPPFVFGASRQKLRQTPGAASLQRLNPTYKHEHPSPLVGEGPGVRGAFTLIEMMVAMA